MTVKPGGMLALDIATATGWAYAPPAEADADAGIVSGVFKCGWDGCHDTQFFAIFDRWIDARLDLLRPRLIAFEAPILPPPKFDDAKRKLKPQTNRQSIRRLFGLCAIVEAAAARHQLTHSVFEVSLNDIKRHATGNWRAPKVEMMDAARERGWTFKDDNECDALWLLDLVSHRIKKSKGVK